MSVVWWRHDRRHTELLGGLGVTLSENGLGVGFGNTSGNRKREESTSPERSRELGSRGPGCTVIRGRSSQEIIEGRVTGPHRRRTPLMTPARDHLPNHHAK